MGKKIEYREFINGREVELVVALDTGKCVFSSKNIHGDNINLYITEDDSVLATIQVTSMDKNGEGYITAISVDDKKVL